MRKKAAGFYADSLEMLLDTMCNILGGIIFITLTLAVLTHDSSTPAANERQTAQLNAELESITASNATLEAQIQGALSQSDVPQQTNLMRLPNISQTTKKPWNVILRHHQVYPLYAAPPAGLAAPVKNTQSLEWRGTYVEPKAGQGGPVETSMAEMVQTFRNTGQTNYYFAFWVYDDSFDTFNRAKEIVFNLGMQYGWEPMAENSRLTLSGRGPGILPQE
jgi:hypothetical protein